LTLLAGATALAYSSSIRGELQFDDTTAVAENVAIRDLGQLVRTGIVRGYAEAGRPITELSFAVDFAMGGLDVRAYHVTNLLLHLVVVALLFLLTRRTLRRLGWPAPEGLALWISGLFALHPLQSQAVSYVSQRAEVLASLFYVLALLLLLEAEERGASRRGAASYAAALLAFVLGLGSKAITVTFPAAWLLYAACFPAPEPGAGGAGPARRWAGRAGRAGPFLLLSALYAAVQLSSLRAAVGAGFDLPSLGPWRYFLTQLRVLLVYLRLLVWPAGQNLDYELPVASGLLEPRTLLPALALAALLAAALWCWGWSRKDGPPAGTKGAARLFAFGILWFLVVLAPTSSVVPLRDVIEEHRVYLASWGVLTALAAAASLLFDRLGGGGAKARRAKGVLALGLCAAAGVALFQRNAVWETRVSLWRDAVAGSPTKARAHENLGHALYLAGDLRGAAAEYRAALRFGADGTVPMPKLLNNVGASLMEMGRLDEAAAFLSHALTIAPDDVRLLNNLAMTRLWKGELDAALATARRAVALFPGDPGAHNALGQILQKRGDQAGAAEQFALEASLNPDLALQLRSAATAQERAGDVAAACGSWGRLLRMRPGARDEELARGRLGALRCPR
jgi:Flp pilus assembly protein TadD